MMFDLSYSVKGEDEPFKMKFDEAVAPPLEFRVPVHVPNAHVWGLLGERHEGLYGDIYEDI